MAAKPAPTLVSRLAEVVKAQPNRPAVLQREQIWSYRDLWARTANVARALRERDIGPRQRVGLVGRNSADYIAGYLGIMRAGAATVVPNALLPASELRRQLELAEVATTLLGNVKDDVGAELVELSGAVQIGTLDAVGSDPLPEPMPADDAVLIPTTGSTGKPKAVVLTHDAVLHAADNLSHAFPVAHDDVTIAFLPLFAAIYEQVLPILLAGGAVDVLERYEPEAVASACERGTTFDAVPTAISRLLELVDHEALDRLRWIMFASEPMPPAVLQHWWECVPHVETYQFYGMTELLTITHASHVRLRDEPRTVGVPFETSEVHVVDADGQRQPAGVEGEVVCASPTLMRQYFRDGEATVSTLNESGAMLTGDLGVLDESGQLYVTGRSKDIIISGGFNVSPAQIEAIACEHPAVAEAMVVGISDEQWGETPVVVAVARRGTRLRAGELLDHCRSELASFSRPSAAAMVDELPTTGIGKAEKDRMRDVIERGGLDLHWAR